MRLMMAPRFPHARITADLDELLDDDELAAVVIATPSATHADLVERALDAEKHVFVETPMALSVDRASFLVRRAERNGRSLMVGNDVLFHPAVRKLKELITGGALGEIFYLYGNRQYLGSTRSDENVLWNLGAQDLSVLLYLLDDQPIEVGACGESYVQGGIHDVVFCYLRFATGISAHFHLSWLDPHTVRRLTAVGSERMAVIDDMEIERKLTIHDKSATLRRTENLGEYVQVSIGDISCPRLPDDEPLRLQCEHFVSAVSSGRASGARESAAVVGVLEALQRSLDGGGVPLPLGFELPTPSVTPLRRASPSGWSV